MSKQSKVPGTPSTPSSKLPKFLQKGRDRARSDAFATTSSVNNSIRASDSPEPNMPSSVSASSSRVASNPTTSHAPSTSPPIPIPVTPRRHAIDVPEVDVTHDDSYVNDDEDDFSNINDSPVVIEPTPRPGGSRLRADRVQPSLSMYGSPSSSGKITELPNRLSGWISHAFGSSSNDLSLPSILQQASSAPSPSSPRAGGKSNPLLVAAKNGKGHLDKAMRYLLDSDATPDNATESIWLLGFMHSATPPSPALSLNSRPSNDTNSSGSGGGRTSRTKLRGGSSDSLAPLPTPLSHSAAVQLTPKHPGQHWPREFYTDFSTRIWCTYRTQFQPIRDSALSALESEIGGAVQATSPTRRNWWGGEKGWTADTGWGCMLRTGQSLLANALLHLHLGRDWRVPSYPEQTPEFATYVQLLTWFFDTPAPQAPFSVHRMALAGKELGKDVGQWFGPSTAAGAIKTLVQMFPACGLGVAVAADSVVYESDVFSASHGPDEARSPRRHRTKQWGGNAVLVLIGLRLGLDGVNPIYYDTIKILYTFPQSVGIAGGRPSSSYYFVGSQGDNLFYLDPHHARPTVPLRPVPPRAGSPSVSSFDARPGTIPTEVEDPAAAESNAQSTGKKSKKKGDKEKERGNNLGGRRSPLSPTSTLSSGSGRSVFSGRSSMAGPMGHTLSGSSAHSSSSSSPGHVRWQTEALPPSVHHLRGGSTSPMGTPPPGVDLTPEQAHFCSAYSANELRTFHCERVRKMHLSGLDPSMLLGFLCKDERDWRDLRERVNDLKKAHKPIFSIQDEPPAWAGGGGVDADDDSFMGLESFSEDDPEDGSGDNDNDGDGDGEVDEDNEDDELFADARGSLRSASRSPSTSPDLPSDSASSKGGRKGTVYAHPGAGQGLEMPSPPGDGDFTGEDDPRTPGPGRAFPRMQMNIDKQEPDDIDDDWEVPGVPTPGASIGGSPAGRNAGLSAPDMMRSSSANSAMSTGSEISAVSARSTLSVASGRSGKSKSPSTTKRKKRREKEASYPFPVAAAEEEGGGEDGEEEEARERERCETETPANQGHAASGSGVQQASRVAPMRSAIAKDGGRTQSGGVRGVPFALTAELV